MSSCILLEGGRQLTLLGSGTLSLRTPNPLNAREHHFARASRAKAQRQAARMGALIALPPRDWPAAELAKVPRFVVELTRVHPKRAKPLDAFDGLPASLKHVVDGICDHLGVDDGDVKRIRFVCSQEVGEWAVRFRVLEDAA